MSLFDDTVELVMKAERRRFRDGVNQMVAALRVVAPYDTGETERKIGAEREVTSGLIFSAEVVAKTPQADYTNDPRGNDGDFIVPRIAKVLRWIDDGEVIYAKRVRVSFKHKGWFSDEVKDFPDILESVGV